MIQKLEWQTLALLTVCYSLWLGAGAVIWPIAPFVAIIIMALMTALHSSLQHECLHGHPTRNRHINELLVSLPIGVAFPYRRFKALHLCHHADERLTDPYDDPESYYLAGRDWAELPAFLRAILNINNTLIGRIILGPLLMVAAFLKNEMKYLWLGHQGVRKAWLLHANGLGVTYLIVTQIFGIPFWLYIVAVAYPGMSLIAIRTYCEHQWCENPNGRSIIVESKFLGWLFLNNNLHFVHHKSPQTPWYRLPALYAARKREWLYENNGYFVKGYREIFMAYAFRQKEPTIHPAHPAPQFITTQTKQQTKSIRV